MRDHTRRSIHQHVRSQTTGAPCPGACRMGGGDLATREVRANQSSHCGQLYSLVTPIRRILILLFPLSLSLFPSLSPSLDAAPFTVALCSLIIIIATLRQIPTRPAGSTGFTSQILPRPSSARTVLRVCEFVTNEPNVRRRGPLVRPVSISR